MKRLLTLLLLFSFAFVWAGSLSPPLEDKQTIEKSFNLDYQADLLSVIEIEYKTLRLNYYTLENVNTYLGLDKTFKERLKERALINRKIFVEIHKRGPLLYEVRYNENIILNLAKGNRYLRDNYRILSLFYTK